MMKDELYFELRELRKDISHLRESLSATNAKVELLIDKPWWESHIKFSRYLIYGLYLAVGGIIKYLTGLGITK